MTENLDEQRQSYQHAQALREFWKSADRALSRQGRLALLRRFSAIVLRDDPFKSVIPNTTKRKRFQRRKERGFFKLNGWCWVCRTETPDHRHHVLALANGGRNIRKNVLNLCASCHCDVHEKKDVRGLS